MRIAFFGGSFDPPHRGHLAVARAAADAFHLDSILFAPAGRQPLKLDRASSSFADRLAMTTLACAEDAERFQASAIDAPRSDGLPNYTVDTLAELRRTMPDAALFNLVGADSFLDLPRWREPNRLLELAEWIVVSRPGVSLPGVSPLHLTAHQQARVHLLNTVSEEVSATTLRQRLHTGDPCTDLLPAAVSTYIREHHLYQPG
ncbi:MAG TPA: nicotinate-nucleotide adenylyltransferase [Edaphobacter sp.]|nr:nicotinate-nucleotide adenylyltransferase [Edaphobacter sp.]